MIWSHNGLHSHVSDLLDLLFGGDTDADAGDAVTAAFGPFHDPGQPHSRLIGFLQSLYVYWCGCMVVQPIDVQFVRQLYLQTGTLSHPHVLPFFQTYKTLGGSALRIVTLWVDNGSIRVLVDNFRPRCIAE